MYKERFIKLHDDLLKRGDVQIHSFEVRPSLGKKALEEVSNENRLPDDISSFYQETNGFQMSYTFKQNDRFNKEKFGSYKSGFDPMWPNEAYWQLDGCINILPIDLILKQSWKDYVWFESQTENRIVYKGNEVNQLEFEKKVRPFDIFSKSMIAAFFIENNRCDILLGTDHNASFIDYEPISLDDYLNKVIETEGVIDKRTEIFTPV